MERYLTLDELILQQPAQSLLTPVCAKELFVLRTIGINWQHLSKPVVEAHHDLMVHPAGFGPVDFKLYLTRKIIQDSVIQTVGQSVDIPQEFFEWPLSK